jgi:site-specific recombinase XerD
MQPDINQDKVTLREAQRQFVENLQSKGRATATVLAYGKDVDQLVEFVALQHKYEPAMINEQDIENFKVFLKNEKYTSKSISRKVNSIKSFFRFLRAQNFVSDNPAAHVSHPKYEVAPPRVLSKLEYRALRDASRDDVRLSSIIELLLQTGMRIGELSNLHIEDVDLKKKQVLIRPYESRDTRTVPLSDAAVKAIESYLAVRPKSDDNTLFLTKTGNPFLVRNIRTAVDRYFKIAGIENAKVNDLRHTFIIHQLRAGTPINYVSRLVGHKRLSTTEKYLKLIEGTVEKDNVKLEEL